MSDPMPDTPEGVREQRRTCCLDEMTGLAKMLASVTPGPTTSEQAAFDLTARSTLLARSHTKEFAGIVTDAEVNKLWTAAKKNGNGRTRPATPSPSAQTTGTASAGIDPDSKNLTDLGNAERFAKLNEGKIVFDIAQQQWRVWDGKRWNLDHDGAANRMAALTARSIHVEAAGADSKERAESLSRWALGSESRVRQTSMLELAKTMEGIAFPASRFDTGGGLFNCQNGTLDLRTGALRPHDPADLITRISPIAYDPSARHEVFDRVLSEALPDEDVRRWLQKVVGYSMTASVDEEVFFFIHGPTATGKSTVTEAIQGVFGDYARTASTTTFMKFKNQGNARPDVAELAGVRFVLTSEASSEERFDAELLKSFVSGDQLSARFLYARNFEFHPVSKLWITGNSRPRADVVDAALFRRLREIPFVVQVPKSRQDPAIKREMKNSQACGPAILRWMLVGCLSWQNEGLHDPTAIVQAGQEYEAESNPLQEFFDARCVFGPDCVTFLREVYQAYTTWASSGGIAPRFQVSEKRLAAILRARQCSFEQDSHGRFLRGVRLVII